MYTYWIALIEIKTLNTPIYKYMSYADTHPSNMVQHMILQGSRVDSMPKKKKNRTKIQWKVWSLWVKENTKKTLWHIQIVNERNQCPFFSLTTKLLFLFVSHNGEAFTVISQSTNWTSTVVRVKRNENKTKRPHWLRKYSLYGVFFFSSFVEFILKCTRSSATEIHLWKQKNDLKQMRAPDKNWVVLGSCPGHMEKDEAIENNSVNKMDVLLTKWKRGTKHSAEEMFRFSRKHPHASPSTRH